MSDEFDPYYTWLGIPPEDQPADHYRLLGVRKFEPNLDVISNAGDQRMAFLRTFQVGKRSALSQRLLNEMAAAKVCLLDSDRRKAYDAKLKASQPKPVSPAPQVAVAPQVVAARQVVASPQVARPLTPAPSPKYPPPTVAPLRQVPVTRPTPVAPHPSVTPDPFVATDPFADLAKEVQSQPLLPAKPVQEASDDFADQAMAVVRAAVSRVQESPLATAAYGMLALGIVMLLSVGLWIAFGRGRPSTVAGIPSASVETIPITPQQPQSLPSLADQPAVKNSASKAPKVAESETPRTATESELPATLPSEGPKSSPSTISIPTIPSVEKIPESAVKPGTAPSVTPAPTKNLSPPIPEPANALTTAIYNVLPGKFSLPRVARLSPTAVNLAEFVPGSRTVRIWSTSPAKKTAEPLSNTTPTNVRCVRFSDNERLLAIGTDNSINVWDLQSGKNIRVAIPGPGIDAVFCDNDKLVAVTSEGTKTVRLIEVETSNVLHTFQSTVDEILSLAAGEQWLAALGANGQVALYDVRQCIHHGNLVPRPELPLTAVHMRGKHIFAFDSRCMTGWNAQELKRISEWSNTRTTPVFDAYDVVTLDFTQQEKGTLNLFRVANHEAPLARIAAPGGSKFAVVDIAAERLLTIGQDAQLLIWNLERVKEAKGTINPAEAIAAWSGAKPAPSLASTEKLTLPANNTDGAPLETVDAATALEALRGLGLQQLPSTPDQVSHLSFIDTKATDADAKYVLAFPRLEALFCERTPFSGRALRYFQKIPALKTLNLSGCSKISDNDLQLLGKIPNLEFLSLDRTGVTATGIAHLRGLPKLRTLHLPDNLGREVIPVISSLESLQTMYPFPRDITDDDLAQLSKLTHLRALDLQRGKLTPQGYKHLEKFQEATEISLHHQCPREALASLKNMKLQGFHFPQFATDEDVEVFASMPTLRVIFLNNNMSDKAVATISKFSQLEQLGMGFSISITDRGMAPLRQLKSLKELWLHERAGDDALRIVAQIPSMRQLHIPYGGPVTDEGIEALVALPNLTTLTLPQNTSDRSCEAASKLRELQVLEVHGKEITPDGLRKLAGLNKLSLLVIYKQLSAKDAAALKEFKKVNSLMLNRTGLSDAAIAELTKALPGVQIHVSK